VKSYTINVLRVHIDHLQEINQFILSLDPSECNSRIVDVQEITECYNDLKESIIIESKIEELLFQACTSLSEEEAHKILIEFFKSLKETNVDMLYIITYITGRYVPTRKLRLIKAMEEGDEDLQNYLIGYLYNNLRLSQEQKDTLDKFLLAINSGRRDNRYIQEFLNSNMHSRLFNDDEIVQINEILQPDISWFIGLEIIQPQREDLTEGIAKPIFTIDWKVHKLNARALAKYALKDLESINNERGYKFIWYIEQEDKLDGEIHRGKETEISRYMIPDYFNSGRCPVIISSI